MRHLEGILDLIDKEFGDMVQAGKFRNKDDIELAYKMVDIAKDVYCIWDYEDNMDNGYSEYGNYPMNGNSYARGRAMPRNSRGQFTSREGSYNGRNSYRGNYSRADAKSEFIDQLYDMMDSAPDEHTRDRIQKMIREMEQQ